MNRFARAIAVFAIPLLMALGIGPAFAQNYPSKPVRIVIPYAPGGLTDVLCRALVEPLSAALNQRFYVDNKPGAGLIIGTTEVARAAPDGYTLLLGTDGSISANPYLYSQLAYDPPKDFTPVAMLVFANEILMVPPGLPVRNVQEFVEYAKANPKKLNYGSFGVGSPPHLAMGLLSRETGIELVHIPYKGNAPAQAAMLGGEIQAMFLSIPGPLQLLRAGKFKALAIASEQRSPVLPEVPTFAESGYPGFRVEVWFGLLAPSGTPREVVTLLNTEINKVLNDPGFREKFITSRGLDPAPMSVEKFADYLKTNREEIGRMVRITGAKAE